MDARRIHKFKVKDILAKVKVSFALHHSFFKKGINMQSLGIVRMQFGESVADTQDFFVLNSKMKNFCDDFANWVPRSIENEKYIPLKNSGFNFAFTKDNNYQFMAIGEVIELEKYFEIKDYKQLGKKIVGIFQFTHIDKDNKRTPEQLKIIFAVYKNATPLNTAPDEITVDLNKEDASIYQINLNDDKNDLYRQIAIRTIEIACEKLKK